VLPNTQGERLSPRAGAFSFSEEFKDQRSKGKVAEELFLPLYPLIFLL
jgi:hypothetical protein